MSVSRKRKASECITESNPPSKKQKLTAKAANDDIDQILILTAPFCQIFIAFNDESTTNAFQIWARNNYPHLLSLQKEIIFKHKFSLIHPALINSDEYKILMDHILVLHQQDTMSYEQLYTLSTGIPHLKMGQYIHMTNISWQTQFAYISEKVPNLGHILMFTNIARRTFNSEKSDCSVSEFVGAFASDFGKQPQLFASGINYLFKYYSRYIPNILNVDMQNSLFLESFICYDDIDGVKKLRLLDFPIKGGCHMGPSFTCADMWTEVMDQAERDHNIELIERIAVAYNYGKIRTTDLISTHEINQLHNAFATAMIEDEQKNEYGKQMSFLLKVWLKRNALEHSAIDAAKQLLSNLEK